jgi:transposase
MNESLLKTDRQGRLRYTPEHLPIEREEIIPPKVQLDPTAYRRMGEEISEQLIFKRAEFSRKQVVRGKYVLIDNPIAPPVIAPLPPSLQERSIASPSLISEVIYNRIVLHLPYYRQVEMFNSMGVNFHRKTLCDWALLGSDWLDIIYRNIQQEHWRSPYRQLDETPIRYLEPGTGKAQTGYLWTSNIPGGSVFFHWHEGRDAKGIDTLFAEDPEDLVDLSDEEIEKLTAVIQCDGYQVYRSRAEKRRWLKLIGCQAHMRRKFFEAQDHVGNGESGRKCAILYTIVENCRRHKIDVRDYLTDILTRLPAMHSSEAGILTPANWQKARQAKAAEKVA